MEVFLEKSLKIKPALRNAEKLLLGLEGNLKFTILCGS